MSSQNDQKTATTTTTMKEPMPDELQQTFIRKAQRLAEREIAKSNAIRSRNRASGIFMAAVVGSIYLYTIMAVKQEKFLDEIDDPEPSKK